MVWRQKKSRLWLVGIDIDTELYSFALKRMMHELSLAPAVTFTGGISDSEVRAFYEGSTCYICMSEHEGFCLPVVEAMHFGLPVVAYNAGALPETILYLRDNNTLASTFGFTLSLGATQSVISAIGIVLTVIFATGCSLFFLKDRDWKSLFKKEGENK